MTTPPTPTRCAQCGTVASETLCHVCKTPRYLPTLTAAVIVIGFGLMASRDAQPVTDPVYKLTTDLKDCTPANTRLTSKVTLVFTEIKGERVVMGCERYQNGPVWTDRVVRR